MNERAVRRYARRMPEGDSLRRAARRLQPLVGERVEAESPHPRAAVTGVAARLDGLRLESVEAVGKNLLLRFEGGVVLPQPPEDARPLVRAAARVADLRPPVARSPRPAARGGAGQRAGARADGRARDGGWGRTSSTGRRTLDAMVARLRGAAPGSRARRRAARPAARRRHREHVEGRGALAGAGLAVALARATSPTRSSARCSRRRRS